MTLNIGKEVSALTKMTVPELRARFTEIAGEATTSRHKEYLIRRIIWRMQANEEGGLSDRARRRAAELAIGADVRLTPPRLKAAESPRVLYRLLELLAVDPGQWCFLPEGEKDVDNLAALGLTASCNPGGAMKWGKLSDDSALAGRRVCIIADRDDAGRRHAQDVAQRLQGKAATVKILELPGENVKDATDWCDEHDAQEPQDLTAELLRLAEAAPIWTPPPAEQAEAPALVLPAFLTPADLLTRFPSQREEIIFGLLRRGEVGNLVSMPKLNKSWLLMQLALLTTQGSDFLEFRTRPGNVLIVDYELAPGTIAKRLQCVMAALGLDSTKIGDRLAIEPLRGKRLDVNGLGHYFAAIPHGRFDLVIIDPLYKVFPADLDENSNVAIAEVYAALQRYAEQLDAALMVVHHLTKGSQNDKAVTDLGAGAGSQSRAADCHLAVRPHAEDNAGVLSGVVRSFPPFEPFAIRWRFPLWEVAPELDPEDLRRAGKRTRPVKEPVAAEPPKPRYDVDTFVADFLTDKPKWRDTILAEATKTAVANEHQAERLLKGAEGLGKAFRWKQPNDARAYFARCPQPALSGM